MTLITGLTREQERRAQALMMTRIIQRYERIIAREIARAMNQAGRLYGQPLWQNTVANTHRERMTTILTRLWTQAGTDASNRLFEVAKSRQPELELKQEITVPVITNAIAGWIGAFGGRKITEITDTTRNDINRVIEQGVSEGLGEREIGRAIAAVAPSKSASRSQTIARTETHGAANGISLDVANESDIRMVKVWLTSKDERTRTRPEDRFDHWEADGQTVAMGQAFNVSGELLEYPGDPSGSAGNVINCRCVVGYEVA